MPERVVASTEDFSGSPVLSPEDADQIAGAWGFSDSVRDVLGAVPAPDGISVTEASPRSLELSTHVLRGISPGVVFFEYTVRSGGGVGVFS